MEMRLGVKGDIQAQVKKVGKAAQRVLKGRMVESTDGLKGDIRKQVQASGLGNRLPGAVRSDVYPKNGDSYSPAGLISYKSPYIFKGHLRDRPIKAIKGRYLAVPMKGVPLTSRRRRMTPQEVEQKFGRKLMFVPSTTARPATLWLHGVRLSKSGQLLAVRQIKKPQKVGIGRNKVLAEVAGAAVAINARGALAAPLFALVRHVDLKRRLSFAHLVTEWRERFVAHARRDLQVVSVS